MPQLRFMPRRSPVRNAVEYAAAVCALKSLEWSPLPLAHWLARRYAGLLDRLIPRLRRAAERNLSAALSELDAAGRARVIDGVFRSIARLLVTFARFPAIRRDDLSR